jgi:Na+/H+ antiporter NhaD/arsenite permease-like protein
MNLALISVGALALSVIVSCVSRLNVGVLAVALAWIVGVYVGGLPVATVMGGFPSSLFLTLAGVTLLFALAQSNGTLERIAHRAVRVCRGNRGVIPVMFFLLSAALASMGPGNIATAALIAPLAMATAARSGIPLFLMAIMVGNGANAGALSPFAPTGIIVNALMARNGLPGFEVRTYLYNLAAHAIVAFGGYALFGGLKLFTVRRPAADPSRASPGLADSHPLPAAGTRAPSRSTGAHQEPATAADGPFERRHWITIGVIAALILAVVFAQVNVGMGAFLGGVIVVLSRSGDDGEAIKRMPWRVIVMVCGVTVLIALVERAQGIDLLVGLVAKIASARTVTAVVAFLTGIVSVYSSTSGVVLPAFLPMVPGLAAQLPGASPIAIATSMMIGGHLVDVSPLSTIGALCMAGASSEESAGLFNKLLAWGLSMTIVGALLCYIVF